MRSGALRTLWFSPSGGYFGNVCTTPPSPPPHRSRNATPEHARCECLHASNQPAVAIAPRFQPSRRWGCIRVFNQSTVECPSALATNLPEIITPRGKPTDQRQTSARIREIDRLAVFSPLFQPTNQPNNQLQKFSAFSTNRSWQACPGGVRALHFQQQQKRCLRRRGDVCSQPPF